MYITFSVIFRKMLVIFLKMETQVSTRLYAYQVLVRDNSGSQLLSYVFCHNSFLFILSMLTNHCKCQFYYMLVETPSGEHLMAYAVCYP